MMSLIISAALDTNGQNARYVKAADRWGADPDVLKAFAIGNDDPAGVVARFKEAGDRHGGIRIRSAHKVIQYFQFPHDLIWNKKTEPEIRQLAQEADVVHLNNSYMAAQRFGLRKPMLLHHHGSMFRNNVEHMLAVAKSRRMLQAVSTMDLTRPDTKLLHWLPSAYNVDELHAYGEANRREPDGRVRIVHAPTNRGLKHTDLFITVVRKLLDEGLPIDLVLVEGKTWAECLAAKAKADIVFDQLLYGYGCNSIEAWAMGVPVICGADDWTLDRMLDEWGQMPFIVASEAALEAVIRKAVKSKTLRQEYAGHGMAHVRRFHDEKPALARLAELYGKAIRHYTSLRIPGKGVPAVRFRSATGRAVYFEGERIDFPKGEVRVDDPILIARLRYFVQQRPSFGITEV